MRLAETEAPVLSFCMAGAYLYLLYGRQLAKAEKDSGRLVQQVTVFAKEGKARLIRSNSTLLAVSDFCNLLVFRQDTLEKTGEWKLGTDLSSDICGLFMDESAVYACIRNGKITRISLTDLAVTTVSIGEASSWTLTAWEDRILAGTVDGKLLCLDRETLVCEKDLTMSRQNLRSLYVNGDTLYVAGQDKKLYAVDLKTFTCVRKQNNLHRMMFDIAGMHGGLLYTLSHPAREIRAWAADGSCALTMEYPLRLSGSSYVDGERLLLCSRNIPGIDAIPLTGEPC